MATKSLTLLIDGNNSAYRARYAYNLSYRGQDVSVTFGSMKMLIALIKRFKPAAVVYCWDGGIPDFRKELVPEYKAHRHKQDDPTRLMFIAQLNELQRILFSFGVLSVRRIGVEADDLLYQASRMLDESLIVTSDSDLLQAIESNVSVFNPNSKQIITLEDMDIEPAHHAEWKAWQGDSSDNIPGVKGVGPKTATKYMLEGPKALSKRINDKMREFLESGKFDDAWDCINLDLDRTGSRYILCNTEWSPYRRAVCTNWCMKYGFTSLMEQQSLGMIFGSLNRPVFDTEDLAMPRIWDYRRYPKDG